MMALKYRGNFGISRGADLGVLPWLAIFVALVFLTGGGARADIQSLVFLRPISIACLGIAFWGLRRDQILHNRFLFMMLAAITGLTILHLIPLPPSLWHLFPGRELAVKIDDVVGLKSVWRPLSLVPAATENALFSLAVPGTVLLLCVRINDKQRMLLLSLLLLMGLLSGIIGLLQAIGPSKSPLYLYRITNNGAAVGLFANRNHQAVFLSCLFPMLAVYASIGVRTATQSNRKLWSALAAGILLIPLILVTGSRAGLVTAAIGIMSVLVLYRKPIQVTASRRARIGVDSRIFYLVSGAIAFAVLLFFTSRAQSLLQLGTGDEADELRFQMWGPIWEMAKIYMPLGSGIGSFDEIYRVHEPTALLSTSYRNHAHNDWLEIALTGGIPALLILLIAVLATGRAAWEHFRAVYHGQANLAFARLGTVIVLILAVGSIGDYPLRTPSLAGLFVIAAVWAGARGRVTPTGVTSQDKRT